MFVTASVAEAPSVRSPPTTTVRFPDAATFPRTSASLSVTRTSRPACTATVLKLFVDTFSVMSPVVLALNAAVVPAPITMLPVCVMWVLLEMDRLPLPTVVLSRFSAAPLLTMLTFPSTVLLTVRLATDAVRRAFAPPMPLAVLTVRRVAETSLVDTLPLVLPTTRPAVALSVAFPVVEMPVTPLAVAKATLPAAALSVTAPPPLVASVLPTIRSPVVTVTWMLPALALLVTTPVPPRFSPVALTMTMSPETVAAPLLVAVTLPVFSDTSLFVPSAPMPWLAVSDTAPVAPPVDTSVAAEALVIAPLAAVSVAFFPAPVVMPVTPDWVKAMPLAAVSVTLPALERFDATLAEPSVCSVSVPPAPALAKPAAPTTVMLPA